VGNYEFLRVTSVSGVRINFTSNILKIYGATTSNSVLTGQKVTVQRVPNWGAVSVTGSISLTCSAWDGTTGGLVVFRATATVTVGTGASIDVSGKGFRGGVANTNGAEDAHNPNITTGGENGGAGQSGPGGNGGSGSGGGTGGNGGSGSGSGGAGTGGSNGGGGGGSGWQADASKSSAGGAAPYSSGSNYSTNTLLVMGGGAAHGGGGGAGSRTPNVPSGGNKNGVGGTCVEGGSGGNGGSGNCGGGIILVYANQISGSGGITANGGMGGGGGGGGGNGEQNGLVHAGGGGGGAGACGAAGGSVVIKYNSGQGYISISATGGSGGGGGGGGGSGDDVDQGAGGGGGAGANGGGGGAGRSTNGVGANGGNGGNAGQDIGNGYGGSAGGGGGGYGSSAAANTGGAKLGGENPGANASGLNGGTGGAGCNGGGGGGAQGATGASGYSCIVSTGFRYCYLGNYKSDVLNSGASDTKVHQVDWNPSSQAAGTDIDVYARASNTFFAAGDGTPSWTAVSNGGNPALVGRYIQWMSTFTTTSSTTTPVLQDITLTYTSPPPQATGVSGTVLGVSSITWNWTDNSVWEEGFKIYCATSSTLLKTTAADIETWTETGLKANTTYQRYIQSYNTAGSSNSATATKVTLCNSPINMTIASPSYTQLELNWDANGNPDGTKYIAHCSPDGFATVYSSTVTTTTATFNSLTRNTEYEVRVYAVNHEGVCTGYLGPYSRRTQPGTWQEKTTARTGKNSYGFEGDGIWTWEAPANGGSAVTITAYAQYNSDYGGAAKPKITLSNMGVNSSAQMTGGAGVWEKLTVSGTPSGKGVLFLKVEGFSTEVGAKYFVDDIQINQP